MSFFNFLRRVNRGIVLGIIMIIGLSVYLVVDNINFKDERESIKQVLEDYAEDMGTFLMLPEQYSEIGVKVPDSVIENKMKENNLLLDKYFVSTNSYGWNMKESISRDLKNILESNNKTGNKIKSNDAVLARVKSITKHGTNLVTLEAVMNLTTTSTMEAEGFHIFYNSGHWYDENSETAAEMAFMTRAYEITFTCEMTKQNGVWKFSQNEGMSTASRY